MADTKKTGTTEVGTTEVGTKVSFKDTLNLPHTDFPIRANAKVDDPAMIERWTNSRSFSYIIYS